MPVLVLQRRGQQRHEPPGAQVPVHHRPERKKSKYEQQCNLLYERLNELTLIGVGKTPEGSSSDFVDELVVGMVSAVELRGDFELSDNWTLYDEEVL